MLKSKVQTLNDFIDKYKDLPKQGTKEWHAIRGIGGSELNRLLKDEAGLVANKVGLTKIPDMLAMRWGTLLEDTLRNICCCIFNTNIYEASSIPSADVKGKTFSMDGLGIVRFLFEQADDKDYEFFMFMFTLFEFKCPYSREIKQNQVYPEYIPQVKSGMSDLDIPEIALYIEGVFRVSRYEELCNSPWVETWLHKKGNPKNHLPMSYGFIGFYMEVPDIPDESDGYLLYNWLANGNNDFAKLENTNSLNSLLKFMKAGDVKCWSSAQNFSPKEFSRCQYLASQKIPIPKLNCDMDDQLGEFYKFCRLSNFFPLGILGIKLMDINIVAVEKEPHYTKQFEPQILAAIHKINLLNAIEDISERQLVYNQLYNKKSNVELTDDEDLGNLDSYIC